MLRPAFWVVPGTKLSLKRRSMALRRLIMSPASVDIGKRVAIVGFLLMPEQDNGVRLRHDGSVTRCGNGALAITSPNCHEYRVLVDLCQVSALIIDHTMMLV